MFVGTARATFRPQPGRLHWTRPSTFEPARATLYMRSDRAGLSSYSAGGRGAEATPFVGAWGRGGARRGCGSGSGGGTIAGPRNMAVGTLRSRLLEPGASSPRLERNTRTHGPHHGYAGTL
jgi:hypothetical protein